MPEDGEEAEMLSGGDTGGRSASDRGGANRVAGVRASGDAAHEMPSAWRRGAELARAVVRRYGTTDVYEICARAGVRLTRARWALVTAGECDHARACVSINLAAVERAAARGIATDFAERTIVAHELGHLFDNRWRAPRKERDRSDDEQLAHGFAACLLAAAADETHGVRGS